MKKEKKTVTIVLEIPSHCATFNIQGFTESHGTIQPLMAYTRRLGDGSEPGLQNELYDCLA